MHPPNQPLMLSAKQGGIGYHFYRVFGMTRPGARTPNLPVSGRTLYHKATEPVYFPNC